MKNHVVALLVLISLAAFGCGKKDSDKAAGDKPATTETPAPAPAAAANPPAAKLSAAELPADCKEFTAAFETLMKCDALKDQRDSLKAGYEQMLKAMVDLGDTKAMAEGCKAGLDSLKEAVKTAGC